MVKHRQATRQQEATHDNSNVEEEEEMTVVQARISVFCALIGFYSFGSFLAANLMVFEFQQHAGRGVLSGDSGAHNPTSHSLAAQLLAFKAAGVKSQQQQQQQQLQRTTFSASSSSSLPPPTIKRDTSQPLIVSLEDGVAIDVSAWRRSLAETTTTTAVEHSETAPKKTRTEHQTTKTTTSSAVANTLSSSVMVANIPKLRRLVVFNAQAIRPRARVQFLLDYAVVGFAKCGTTTLSLWLDEHPEISDFPTEVWDLYHGLEVKFIQRLYAKVLEEAAGKYQRRIHGYKCPGDIMHDRPLNTLRTHFPKTKLIISMRHPLLFFQSFYNYRASLKQFHRIPGKPNDLIGPEKQYDILATSQAAFHVFLASLGKTDMTSEEERQLLRGFYKDEILEKTPIRMPQKVFLMDTTQLADVNATRSEIFRQDMETFLGLQQPLASIPHARPNAHHERRFKRQVKRVFGGKINICDDEHLLARQELLRISRAASQWIRHYLVKSPDVFVSSPEFFDEVIKSWMLDPCDEPSSSASLDVANTTSTI